MMRARKKTSKARIIRLLGAALVAGLFVGCVNPFNGNGDSQDAAANGSGSVEVLLGTLGASSIIPDVATTVNEHRVTLSRNGYADITQNGAADSNGSGTITINSVPVGTWDVLVEAIDTGQDPVAVVGSSDGTHTVSVTTGGSASVGPITVTPTSGGTGALDLTINWPADEVTGIAEDTLTLQGSSTLDISLALTGSPTTGATYTNASLGSGSYTLLLRLERDDGSGPVNVATIIEAIHIYDNVTTEGTITLTGSDIAQPPAAPTDLTATVSSTSGSDTIDLSWTDNSNTETGFEIERSDDGGTTWTSVTTEAANAVTYSDAGLGSTTTYAYRVRAVNSFGSSEWVGGAGVTATTEVSPYIYVSWDGGDDTTGSGTAANPYASVTQGLAEAAAGQTIRVAGTTGSEEYSEAPMLWKTQVSLEGGWSPDLSTHAPSTYETVIRADISAGTEHFIRIDLATGPIDISHVTLINHSTTNNWDPVVWINGSGDITLDTVVVEADGPVSASAIRTDGSGTSDVVIRNSTIRTLSIPTADSGSNWAYGVVADKFYGSLTIENTDITVNEAYIAAAVKQESGDLTIVGGSLTNAVTTESASRGVWVFGGLSLTMDGVTVTTSDSNTANSEGVRVPSITTSVEVLNSDITIGASSGGLYNNAIGIEANNASDRIILRGNTVTFNTAAVGNSGDLIGIDINDTASGSTVKIDRNTVVFGADADGASANGIDIRDGNNASASTLEVTNNLVYREDGNDAYFAGVMTNLTSITEKHDIFIANNTFVSLDSSGTASGFWSIVLKAGSGSEIVNNIIQAGGEDNANSLGVYIDSSNGDYPSRVESNFIDAYYLFDYLTTISDVNDATRVTHDSNSDGDGDGIATGNVTALTTAFADPTSGDFDLTASSAAALRTGGADLSAVFDSDIEGVTRSTGGANGSDWSIGAFEY